MVRVVKELWGTLGFVVTIWFCTLYYFGLKKSFLALLLLGVGMFIWTVRIAVKEDGD